MTISTAVNMHTALPKAKQQAIVLGGSLAGLLTACVLSQYFGRVSIIERDTVHRASESRKGQPQTRHLHGILPRGLEVMSHYFPGLLSDLELNGAKVVDFAASMNWFSYGGFRKTFTMGINGVMVSRPLLEHVIRERVLALPNVSLLHNTIAKKLIASSDCQKVTGVVTEGKNSGSEQLHDADLIVDATGRALVHPSG